MYTAMAPNFLPFPARSDFASSEDFFMWDVFVQLLVVILKSHVGRFLTSWILVVQKLQEES